MWLNIVNTSINKQKTFIYAILFCYLAYLTHISLTYKLKNPLIFVTFQWTVKFWGERVQNSLLFNISYLPHTYTHPSISHTHGSLSEHMGSTTYIHVCMYMFIFNLFRCLLARVQNTPIVYFPWMFVVPSLLFPIWSSNPEQVIFCLSLYFQVLRSDD